MEVVGMTYEPLSPFLSEKERSIYESGCRDLMAALLEARRGGQHGTISLACGLDPRVRSAKIVKQTERVVIVASQARRA